MKLVARALVSDSYFATADSAHPIETPTTPFLIADFEDDEEYKALFSNVKSRAMSTLQALARQWPMEALQEARFLVGQMVRRVRSVWAVASMLGIARILVLLTSCFFAVGCSRLCFAWYFPPHGALHPPEFR